MIASACSVGLDGMSALDMDDRIELLILQAVTEETDNYRQSQDRSRARLIAQEVGRLFPKGKG